jgi:hypothetical protein
MSPRRLAINYAVIHWWMKPIYENKEISTRRRSQGIQQNAKIHNGEGAALI